MTDKAYIVANEEQECEVLEDLYKRDKRWAIGGKNKSSAEKFGLKFPYVIYEFLSDNFLKYGAVENIESDSEIGFKPQGGIFSVHGMWYQAMIKEAEV